MSRMTDEEMRAFLNTPTNQRQLADVINARGEIVARPPRPTETDFLRAIFDRVCALEAAMPKPGTWAPDGSWRCHCTPGDDENEDEEAPWMDASWLFCSDCGTPRPDTTTRPDPIPSLMTHQPMSPSQLEAAQAAVADALRVRDVPFAVNLGTLGHHTSTESAQLVAARDAEIYRLRIALTAIAYIGTGPDALARSVGIAQDALKVVVVAR
jgi:hypothetical protein